MSKMVDAITKTLSELADKADVIAVAGENRYVNGVYVPSCAEVMHAMRDNIRALERQLALAKGVEAARRSYGDDYADYIEQHDAELAAKGYDPKPWPLSLQGNDGL